MGQHFTLQGFGDPTTPVIARPRPAPRLSVREASTLTASEMALVAPYAESVETKLPGKMPKGLIPKSGIHVDRGEIDYIEATTRFLVWKGHPIERARSIADVAVALSELRRTGPGRKRRGPHLYKRGDWIHMTDGFDRETTGCPVKGEDWMDDTGANAMLAVMVEKRVRKVLGKVLKKDVTISEMFAIYLVQNKPGPGADQRTKERFYGIENDMTHLEKFMGGNTLADLGQNSGKQYFEHATAQQIESQKKTKPDDEEMAEIRYIAKSTARTHVVTLVMVTRWFCAGENQIEPILIKIPRVTRRAVAYLTVEEIVRLISAARGRIYDNAGNVTGHHDKRERYEPVIRFICLYLYGGTRHRNILELTWFKDDLFGHINPELDFIERQGGLAEITDKRRGTSFLIGSLRWLATRWKAEDAKNREKHPGLFVHIIHDSKGRPIGDFDAERSSDVGKQMRTLFNEVRELAALPKARPHQLKHSGATYAVRAGMPTWEVEIAFSTTYQTLHTYYVHLAPWLKEQPISEEFTTKDRRAILNKKLMLFAMRHLSSEPMPGTDA